ncbi:MAG: DUF58 domain-containing protein [Myxococcales bacterium]|nr:DUF58 domain-containing protein [Myxococcales bacterium]
MPRRRTRLRRLRARLARWWGYVPISGPGLLAGAAAWGAFAWYGRGQSDFVVRAAAIVVLAVLAISVLGVTLAALWVFWRLDRAGDGRVEAVVDVGDRHETALRVPRLRWWPLVTIGVAWERPAAVEVALVGDGALARERVVFTARGKAERVVRVFTVSDLFGLARLAFTRRAAAHLVVRPALTTVDLAAAIRHAAGDGHAHPAGEVEGDLVEMRRYAPGDPVRMILWKAYARTRRLLVRMPERAVAPQPSTVAYFVAGEGDEPSASVARTFVEAGLLGPDFTFGADGAEKPATTPAEAIDAIIEAVAHRDSGGAGLAAFAAAVPRERLGRCILFVPGDPGPWQDHLAAFVRGLPAPPVLITSADGVLARRRSWLRQPPPTRGSDLRALPRLYDALRALDAPVKVVHRSGGRVLAESEIDALRHA